jgi:hypothetical protein
MPPTAQRWLALCHRAHFHVVTSLYIFRTRSTFLSPKTNVTNVTSPSPQRCALGRPARCGLSALRHAYDASKELYQRSPPSVTSVVPARAERSDGENGRWNSGWSSLGALASRVNEERTCPPSSAKRQAVVLVALANPCLARAAVSCSIRHSVFSQSGMSRRDRWRSMAASGRARVSSGECDFPWEARQHGPAPLAELTRGKSRGTNGGSLL